MLVKQNDVREGSAAKCSSVVYLILWPLNLVKILLMMRTEALEKGVLAARQLGLSGSFMGS